MARTVVYSLAGIVLLTASASFAGEQAQDAVIGLGNTIQLLQGNQAANAIQNLAVSNCQDFDGNTQSLLANLAEIGHASGECAIVGVGQALTAMGSQAQLIGDGCGDKAQGQSLGLTAGQELIKTEGPGAGSALHQIVLDEGQYGVNMAGTMQAASAILGLQNTDLTGAACATGNVDSTMGVNTTQTQATL